MNGVLVVVDAEDRIARKREDRDWRLHFVLGSSASLEFVMHLWPRRVLDCKYMHCKVLNVIGIALQTLLHHTSSLSLT